MEERINKDFFAVKRSKALIKIIQNRIIEQLR